MKNIKITCIGLLILLFIFKASAQNSNTYARVKYFLGDSVSNHNKICAIARYDSTYYLQVVARDSMGLQSLNVFKTDVGGNVLDHFQEKSSGKVYYSKDGKSIIVDADFNIVSISHYYSIADSIKVGYLLKLTPDLDTIWSRSIIYPDTLPGCVGNQPFISLYALQLTSDGGYIIVGEYYIDCYYLIDSERVFLIKFDTNGKEEWRRYYPNKRIGRTIEATVDGGIIYPECYFTFRVIKTDSLGNILWETVPNTLHHYSHAEVACKDGYIIAVSPYAYNFDSTSDPYEYKWGLDFCKLDQASGQVIWNRQFRTFDGFRTMYPPPVIPVEILSNDEIIVAGTTDLMMVGNQLYYNKGMLFKLSPQGDSLWCRLYNVRGAEHPSSFKDVVVTDDGGFLAGGYMVPYDYAYANGAVLVKTDSMGLAPGAITLDVQEFLASGRKGIVVYPNPAGRSITFDAGEIQAFSGGDLHIYNTKGQQVLQLFLNSAVNDIDIKDFSPGIYLYRLLSDGKEYRGKFMKM